MEKATKILPVEPWVMTISNQQIVMNHKKEFQWALNGPPAQKYWKSKLHSISPSLNKLDTEAMERPFMETHPTWRQWATKQITRQCAHGKNDAMLPAHNSAVPMMPGRSRR